MKSLNLFILLSTTLAFLINGGYAYDTPNFDIIVKTPTEIEGGKNSPEYQEFVDTVVEEIHDIIMKNKDLCDNPDDIDFIQEDYDVRIKNDPKIKVNYPRKYATIFPISELDNSLYMIGYICPQFVDQVKVLPYITFIDIPAVMMIKNPWDNTYGECEAKEYGYPCCPAEFNTVKYHNELGDWGFDLEHSEWCSITTSFEEKKKEDKCFSESLGYPCCSTCTETVYIDKNGNWGIENGEWCGITNTQVKNEEEEKKCITESIGYPCCSASTETIYTDDEGKWGVEKDEWCLII